LSHKRAKADDGGPPIQFGYIENQHKISLMKFCCKLSGLAGLVSGFVGALFLAIATWPIPDGGYVPDPEKIQTEYHFVVMKYPDLYK